MHGQTSSLPIRTGRSQRPPLRRPPATGAPVTSGTVEDYLKQLYAEQYASGESAPVTTGRLAVVMGVTPGTATSMVKSLAASGLVRHELRKGVQLTAEGETLALSVLRRHRLMELFLVEVLKLDWSVVHEEAEMLEHAISDRVLERVDSLLGHPTVDPHGDPIPSATGHVEGPNRTSLANCPLNEPQRVRRILKQDPEFLRFAEREGLVPGATLLIIDREAVAESVRIRVLGREISSLGLAVAHKIIVQPVIG